MVPLSVNYYPAKLLANGIPSLMILKVTKLSEKNESNEEEVGELILDFPESRGKHRR